MSATVLLPIGIPGIGKSTLLTQQSNGEPMTLVSRDVARSKINGGDATFVPANEGKVSEETFRQLRKALSDSKKPNKAHYIALDMTNIDARSRKDYLEIVRKFAQKNPVLLKVFHLPNDVALSMQRQEGRDRKVEQTIVQSYADRFERFHASEIEGTPKLTVDVYDVGKDAQVIQQHGTQPATTWVA